jgi:GTP:adenosylcobinamide-phosphate guanylyltransferase
MLGKEITVGVLAGGRGERMNIVYNYLWNVKSVKE